MDVPADVKGLINRINEVTKEGPRYGCQFYIDIEGMPKVSIMLKTWSYPAMKGSEASEYVVGTEIPMKGVKQFGGNDGFPCQIKVKRGGKQQKELMTHFFSGEWIDKVRATYTSPTETPAEGEIVDFFGGKISLDATAFEDDANTENLVLEGEFKYKYWLPGS